MFKKVAIANRGEIALRGIRACKDLDIETLVFYTSPDKESLPVSLADESILLENDRGYLDYKSIVKLAKRNGADAVFPGYGFQSESKNFARRCGHKGIQFIGPSARSINLMGNKLKAKRVVGSVGGPLTPGNEGLLKRKELLAESEKVGFPLILKAVHGGGGRGIRVVESKNDIFKTFDELTKETSSFFKRGGVYLEKYISNGRHIEIQILGDRYGNIIHLGDRECSIQRKHQKLIEETPAPNLSEKIKNDMYKFAIDITRKANYYGAGTIEFILNGEDFYFLEMNTRIQVEHGITEMVTNVDILKELIKVISGEPLQLKQEEVKFNGHSLECRINAEDPSTFLPNPGEITSYLPPGGPGVRVDSHLFPGYMVPYQYDSLISKLMIHSEDRMSSISRMRRALDEYIIQGINTNIPLHQSILSNQSFIDGVYSTALIDTINTSLPSLS